MSKFIADSKRVATAPSTGGRHTRVCPECGCELTYVGFTNVECSTNTSCSNYRERTLPLSTTQYTMKLSKEDVFFAQLAQQAGTPVTAPPAPRTGTQDVAWARCWMANGGRVEARAKQPGGGSGLWLPIYGVADLASIQGIISDDDFNKAFDFRVA